MCNFCNNPYCNSGGLCGNNYNNGLLCMQGGNWGCDEVKKCGCPIFLPSSCSYYDGAVTPCLGITTNTTLTAVIQRMDAAICSIPTPSGSPSGCPITVSGTNGQITVSQTGSGCSSNYQVGLDGIITTDITNIQSSLNTISTFLNTATNTVTTNTPQWLSVSNPSPHVWNIDYIQNPSGLSGIINSNYGDSTTANTSWTTVKSYTIQPNQLNQNGDKLVVQTRFTCAAPNILSPSKIRVQFNGITIMSEFTITSANLNVIDVEVWLIRYSNSTIEYILKSIGGSDNGTYFQTIPIQGLSYLTPINGLNLSTTPYNINCDIKSAIAGDTLCRFLEIEYKHKI